MSDRDAIHLRIENLSCGGCAARAERALQGVEGLRAARVNLATHAARFEMAEAAVLPRALAALSAAGYPAARETRMLRIEGMHCASCTGRVERALNALPGIEGARVNLAAGTARVEALRGTPPEAMFAALRDIGYTAYPHDGGSGARPGDEDDAPRADGDTAPSQDTADDTEDRALRRDLAVAAVLTTPLFVLEMGGHLVPALHHALNDLIGAQTWRLVQFALATAVLAGPGRRFFGRGLPALWRRVPDMNSLVALGTGAAWGFSTLVTFAPTLLPEPARAVYFEAAAVIVTLILLGRWLELRARGRTGTAIRELLALSPEHARIEVGGTVREVALATLRPGDTLLVRPGERVAADGRVIDGRGFVDESMISGEPMPVDKAPGDPVTGGTLNGNGALRVEIIGVGADTALARIVRMVEEAQAARLPIQAMVDRVTLVFVPAVLAVALVTVAVWLVFGPTLAHALTAGVSVLIVACPCAMGLATPAAITVGTGRAAAMGVLFRRGEALQTLSDVTWVAFDKTGTLTLGEPTLRDLEIAPGVVRDDVLSRLAGAEAQSEHPVARAVIAWAATEGVAEIRPDTVEALPGFGVRARFGDQTLLAGNAALMAREGIDIAPMAVEIDACAATGAAPLIVALDGACVAVGAIADPPRPQAAAAIAALKRAGLRVAMITGDAEAPARHVANALGIDRVVAGVPPDGKVAAVRDLRRDGTLAFVGDGINDAPALAAADVGIAIGTGTDVAVQSADVVLMGGDPGAVARARDLSRATLRNLRQNLGWAFGYNILLIPVAAGVLYPFGGPLLSPMLAAGAMALSSVFVLGNALRLRRIRLGDRRELG